MQMLFNRFSLDTKSLSIFRILLGFLLVFDGLQKMVWARHFYSDWGILPRVVWITDYMADWKLSLHLASGDTWFQVALLAIQVLAAVAFLVGWKTRWAGFVVFILMCSLQSRNNLILSAADDLIRLCLFWSLFLPTATHFSLTKETVESPRVASWASVAFILQLFLMYITTAIFKKHPVWLSEGSAVYYALNIDMFVKPLGVLLRDAVGVTQLLTWATLAIEVLGALLIFGAAKFRLSAVLIFLSFHFGLFLVFEIGTFPWIAMIYWVALLPSLVWDSKIGLNLESLLNKFFEFLAKQAERIQLRLKSESSFRQTKIGGAFLLLCLVLMLVANIAGVLKVNLPKPVHATLHSLYLNQQWDMFAPYPIRNDGWFVIEGSFENQETRDLMTGLAPNFEKPQYASEAYENAFWRKWYLNVWDKGNKKILLPFARYLCRKYSHSETGLPSVKYIQVNFMKETTPPMGESPLPVEKRVLWQHDCFKN